MLKKNLKQKLSPEDELKKFENELERNIFELLSNPIKIPYSSEAFKGLPGDLLRVF